MGHPPRDKQISRDSPLSVLSTAGASKTNSDYNIKVDLILLTVFACENTPRSWAPRDLVLTWYTSTLRQTQQPVPEELVGSHQPEKRHYSTKRSILSLVSSSQGQLPLMNYAQAWNHYTNPMPTKIFLDDFSRTDFRFTAYGEVNRKWIYQTAELNLYFVTNTLQSTSRFFV